MNNLTIVAQQGPTRFLLVPEDDNNPRTKQAQVLDIRRGTLYPPTSLQNIIKEGYWTDYTGDQDVTELLSLAGIEA